MSLQALKLRLGPAGWRLLFGGVRVRSPGPAPDPSGPPVIYACLHRDLIPAILHVRPARPTLLVSRSPDGDILVRILAPHGFGFSRGSTGKDGGRAFVHLLRALRAGRSVGVAVDGPRGPFGEVPEGVVQLSRRSGCPIVPLRVRPGRHWKLRNWDRTVVPCPLSTVAVSEGAPLQVAPDADPAGIAAWRGRLAAELLGSDRGASRPDPPAAGAAARESGA